MLAESWEELKPDTLQKSWCELWLEVMDESDQIKDEQNDMQQIIEDLLTVQVNMPASEVKEWFSNMTKTVKPVKNSMTTKLLSLFSKIIVKKLWKRTQMVTWTDLLPGFHALIPRMLLILPFSTSSRTQPQHLWIFCGSRNGGTLHLKSGLHLSVFARISENEYDKCEWVFTHVLHIWRYILAFSGKSGILSPRKRRREQFFTFS